MFYFLSKSKQTIYSKSEQLMFVLAFWVWSDNNEYSAVLLTLVILVQMYSA